MTVYDVFDFASMEQFIKEKNYVLNCFESQILQFITKHFVEKELFFLVKDKRLSNSLDFLMHQYSSMIDGNFSPHQIPRVAVCNSEGDFWVKTEQFSHYAELREGEGGYCTSIPVNDVIYQKFPDVFQNGIDYQIIYEDESVVILVFLLRVQKCFFDDGTLRFHMEENGYYVDPKRPCDILPYDQPYRYSYFVIPYEELKQSMSPLEFQNMKLYYSQAQEEVKKRQRKK